MARIILKKDSYAGSGVTVCLFQGEFFMETRTFKVPNMTCNGCVATVRGELESIAGVQVLDINKPAQLVTVQWNQPATWSAIENALTAIEYAPAEA
ncbi:heavy-metal-associated domain-containing protein [Anaerolineae bacterium CFX9]|nr:heavy metal-associated domain-containing protein [Oscillatoria laete-virens]MDL1902594.1 heavy-metal-associated domain-containing protein [Anaerolineae bacterium CFX9]MDL5055636.1 heavy metal-associated domain-containing protein [Oscillatoria laete-virens NRMC-F 0139]